jgi:16S rRNA (guanine527-N7)-methyltransferase
MIKNSENWQSIVKEQEFNDLLMEWNSSVNLVSRKKANVFDLIEDSKLFFGAIDFAPGMNILDLGTGGGFPGIVIAINHPEVNLVLVDSIQKKINVVNDIIKRLELSNTAAICSRAEELATRKSPPYKGGDLGEVNLYVRHFHYIVSRSVAVLQDLSKWSKELIKPGGRLVSVKGGDITGEIHKTRSLPYVKNVTTSVSGERKIVTVEFK